MILEKEDPMSYKIGSFNLLNLTASDETKSEKDFKKIAKIIRHEKFDIVALQEVLSEDAVKQLVKELGERRWDFKFDTPETYAGKSEGYAYIWNNNRIMLVDDVKNPMIYKRYTSHYQYGSQGLVRAPYVIRLTPIHVPEVEFRLINTHIAFNKSANYGEEISKADLRRKEYDILTQDVYRLVSMQRYGDNRVAYTFLMGDYNLCLSGTETKIKDTVEVYLTRNLFLTTVQDKKTTLKQSGTVEVDDVYSQDYDHFTFDKCYKEKMRIKEDRVDAIGRFYNNDVELYRTEISDHVPIKIEIDLKTKGERV